MLYESNDGRRRMPHSASASLRALPARLRALQRFTRAQVLQFPAICAAPAAQPELTCAAVLTPKTDERASIEKMPPKQLPRDHRCRHRGVSTTPGCTANADTFVSFNLRASQLACQGAPQL